VRGKWQYERQIQIKKKYFFLVEKSECPLGFISTLHVPLRLLVLSFFICHPLVAFTHVHLRALTAQVKPGGEASELGAARMRWDNSRHVLQLSGLVVGSLSTGSGSESSLPQSESKLFPV
jgi:hypothetical protein